MSSEESPTLTFEELVGFFDRGLGAMETPLNDVEQMQLATMTALGATTQDSVESLDQVIDSLAVNVKAVIDSNAKTVAALTSNTAAIEAAAKQSTRLARIAIAVALVATVVAIVSVLC